MSYLFGPVNSSRLGRSLGVDLIPYKICNYDCVYCECGKTQTLVNRRGHFVKLEQLVQEFEGYLSSYGENSFDVVTLTGSGETTLETQLASVIQSIRGRTAKPIAVLTNGSLMGEPEVQEALALADVVLPSLDAASPEAFRKIDQPLSWITVENVILGMVDFRRKYPDVQFWLEILFVAGINDTDEEIQRLKSAISVIKPHQVHVCTVSRPPAYPDVKPISEKRRSQIQNILWPEHPRESQLFRLDAKAKSAEGGVRRNGLEAVLETLKRRPCSLEELALMFGIDEAHLDVELRAWVKQDLLRVIEHQGERFFAYRPSRPSLLKFS